jgi:hypothetical protein
MLIDNEELSKLLDSPHNLVRAREMDKSTRQSARIKFPTADEDKCAIAPLHNGGRRHGDTNLDSETRAIIGAEAQVETLSKVAETHGVSLHHAHELANGMISTAQGVDAKLVEDINKKLETPHELALQKLTKVLLAIPDDAKSLGTIKPKDLTGMAGQLAKVAENMAPLKHEDDSALKDCKLIVYAPTIRQENKYETVQVARPIREEQ